MLFVKSPRVIQTVAPLDIENVKNLSYKAYLTLYNYLFLQTPAGTVAPSSLSEGLPFMPSPELFLSTFNSCSVIRRISHRLHTSNGRVV